jgi:PAS domain-containing protein
VLGTERFNLALQLEGRCSVEEDWQIISKYENFATGFKAFADAAAAAGWGRGHLLSLNMEDQQLHFSIDDCWEGRYQKTLEVCWGSAMVAGKLGGYGARPFGVNCWAEQTAFIARGNPCDEFIVKPSSREIGQDTAFSEPNNIERSLSTREAVLETVLQSTADGIIVVGRSGEIITVNERFFQICRMPEEVRRTESAQR